MIGPMGKSNYSSWTIRITNKKLFKHNITWDLKYKMLSDAGQLLQSLIGLNTKTII